jgi:hypothetical protein
MEAVSDGLVTDDGVGSHSEMMPDGVGSGLSLSQSLPLDESVFPWCRLLWAT